MDWSKEYATEIWTRVQSKADVLDSGCWVWTASCDDRGYPQIGGTFEGHRWASKVHLVAWRHLKGEIPKKGRLIRTCMEHRCVNPEHHRLGSTKDQTKGALAGQVKPTRQTDTERFMSFVVKSQDAKGCWLWDGARSGAGSYGFFWLDKELIGAHRASHILFKGPIPDGQVVMHSCDDRQCVNPEHLSAGSHRDNSLDMVAKGRSMRGDKNSKTVLTDEVIREIRAANTGRHGDATRLANKYNLSLSAMSAILSGRTWKHLV